MLKIRELAVRKDLETALKVFNASLRALGYQVEIRVVDCAEADAETFHVDVKLIVRREWPK